MLLISDLNNISTSLGNIQPTIGYSNLFKFIIPANEYENFITENASELSKFINIQFYEYLDIAGETQKRIFGVSETFTLFELNLTTYKFVSTEIKFNTNPKFFLNNEKFYCYDNDSLFVLIEKNEPLIILPNMPMIGCVEFFKNNLYFTVNNSNSNLFYIESELENIDTNFDLINSIPLNSAHGKILKIITHMNNLYVVQQYAISKLQYNSNETYLNSLFKINSQIIANSIEIIDDNIIFVTSGGIFIFDGNNIKELFSEVFEKLKIEKLSSLVFNNHYYICCEYFSELEYKTMLIELDIQNNNTTIHYIKNLKSIYLIKTINYYLLVLLTNDTDNKNEILALNKNIMTSEYKFIKFAKLYFDECKYKTLTSIYINGTGSYKLKIFTNIAEYEYNSISGIINMNGLGVVGNYFQFQFEGEDYFKIESLEFNIKTIGEKWLIQ